jgi:16S rRNA (uracil1498-N3)-methyltransferase
MGETARQIARVLRLGRGEIVIVLDGKGTERSVRLTQIGSERVDGEIIASRPAIGEPHTHLSLYVGMTQRAKFEWILQKGTELGVTTFIPVITSRSLVRESANDPRKSARWESILREAAEQSGRGMIPNVLPVMPFSKALVDGKTNHSLCLIPWEKETNGELKNRLSALDQSHPSTIAVLIGPEGGFADSEIEMAIENGWIPISLGVRILRMETAALALSALILYEMGDLKPPAGGATDS